MEYQRVVPEKAVKLINQKSTEPIEVNGLLSLRDSNLSEIVTPIKCHSFDASGSQLTSVPENLRVRSRLILDNCKQLQHLPSNLQCGSISLRNCVFLSGLPEGLETWFMDLTGCTQFSKWPEDAKIHTGRLILRNCIDIRYLPSWLGSLSNLDVSGCVQIKELPEGLTISGWLDIGGTEIDSLPKSLQDVTLKWRGVTIDHQIAFHPQELTSSQILAETNSEVRRVMIERMGYLEFAIQAGAKSIDSDTDPGGKRDLLKIPIPDDEDLVGLSCFCPSTGRQYFLRVPPATRTCHQAAAWMAGFENTEDYQPEIET